MLECRAVGVCPASKEGQLSPGCAPLKWDTATLAKTRRQHRCAQAAFKTALGRLNRPPTGQTQQVASSMTGSSRLSRLNRRRLCGQQLRWHLWETHGKAHGCAALGGPSLSKESPSTFTSIVDPSALAVSHSGTGACSQSPRSSQPDSELECRDQIRRELEDSDELKTHQNNCQS
jgi:hypothetical protein